MLDRLQGVITGQRTPLKTANTIGPAFIGGSAGLAFTVAALLARHGQLVCLLLSVMQLGLTLRMLLLGVWREPDGVVIVNYVRTHRVGWPEINHFEQRPGGAYPYVGCLVYRGDRAPLPIVALTTSKRAVPENERKVAAAVDQMNGWLDQARGVTQNRSAGAPVPG